MGLRRFMLALLLLLLPAAGASLDTLGAVTTKPGATLVAAFIEALLANVSTGAIMDVGANNGAWARDTLRACRGRGAATPSLLLVEPQTEFHPVLAKLAKTWGGTLLPKAAWVRDEQLVPVKQQRVCVCSGINGTRWRRARKRRADRGACR